MPTRTGSRLLVAREPVEHALLEAPLAREPVHDLDVRRVARDRPQEPLAPRDRLLAVAGPEHRDQRQRRVAQPAVAVVPVAHAADPLRERGRRRCDDPAGRRIRQRLQHEQRLVDLLVVVAAVGAAGRPTRASNSSASLSACSGSIASGSSSCDGNQVSTNGIRSPGASVNSETVVISSPCTSTGVRRQSASGPGDRDPGVVDAPHPGDDLPVVEADHELRAHPHLAVEALDDPDDVRRLAARRHEVDRAHAPLVRLVDRLQDQRVVPVAARRARTAPAGARSQRPCSGSPSSAAKQAPESKRGKQHQSIDPARLDERRRLQVADQRVVLDPPCVRQAAPPFQVLGVGRRGLILVAPTGRAARP